jgi:hypothetical protein
MGDGAVGLMQPSYPPQSIHSTHFSNCRHPAKSRIRLISRHLVNETHGAMLSPGNALAFPSLAIMMGQKTAQAMP